MIKEICTICINDDFGYCGLRDSKEELKFQHDEHQNVIKCSGFHPSSKLKRMFKLDSNTISDNPESFNKS